MDDWTTKKKDRPMITVTVTPTDNPNVWNMTGTGYVFPAEFTTQLFRGDDGKWTSTYRMHPCWSMGGAIDYIVTNNNQWLPGSTYTVNGLDN
jgi:hypothetical protein